MEIQYRKEKIEKICHDRKKAKKFFGGSDIMAISLLSRVNALEQADTIKDIVVQKTFRFHDLKGERDGLFAIDVKTKQDPWRLILQPLDENKQPFVPCNIDEISNIVQIVRIEEVSKHYE